MANHKQTAPQAPTPQPQPGGVVVPPGRSLADMPRGAPIPPPSGAAKKPNSRQTFRQLLTANSSKDYLVELLVELGNKKGKQRGAWREYLAFYQANLSGDLDSMPAEVRAKCEKIVKELNDYYLQEQDL